MARKSEEINVQNFVPFYVTNITDLSNLPFQVLFYLNFVLSVYSYFIQELLWYTTVSHSIGVNTSPLFKDLSKV